MAAVISSNKREFMREALSSGGERLDGRQNLDIRRVRIEFGEDWGYSEVLVGDTRVLGVVTGEAVDPFPDRPAEGFISFHCHLSGMSGPEFADRNERTIQLSNEINQIVERSLKGSRAIDTAALCIVSGVKVWSIRVEMHVIDNDGNLMDACQLAALSALLHYRQPEVAVSGDQVTIYSREEREPVALSVHHMPMAITFGLVDLSSFAENAEDQMEDDESFDLRDAYPIADPSLNEEIITGGTLTVALNSHGEICCLHKAGGLPASVELIRRCAKIAAVKVQEITEYLQKALAQDREDRAAKKREMMIRRIKGKEGETELSIVGKTDIQLSKGESTEEEEELQVDSDEELKSVASSDEEGSEGDFVNDDDSDDDEQ